MKARPRFSRLAGGLRIGADFFERSRLRATLPSEPRGVVDHIADLGHPSIDTTRVHPSIVPFFENTASLELRIRSRWHGAFGLAWRMARPAASFVGQFVLPLDEAHIDTRMLAIDRARDGRDDARGAVRTYATTANAMQVVAYATFARGPMHYMSAAFPLPGGHLAGILRLDAIGEDRDGRIAVALTSRRHNGDDAGIWYVSRGLALPLPLRETMNLWAPEMACAPRDFDTSRFEGTTLIGRHEQHLFGMHVVTHDYWFRPARVANEPVVAAN